MLQVRVLPGLSAWHRFIEGKNSMIGKIRKFIAEVVAELKKVSWSTRRDLIDSTWVVIISSAILGVFIGASDFVLSKLVELLFK